MLVPVWHVAALLALLLKRSGKTRARVSATTIKYVAHRSKLRVAFLTQLAEDLTEFGVHFVETSRGYALIAADALDGAPAIKAKDFIWNETKAARKGDDNYEAIAKELSSEEEQEDEE